MKKRKLISELKNLIKKINPFEILLGIIFLIVIFWLMVRTRATKEWIQVEVKVSPQYWWTGESYQVAPPFWLAESVKEGDQEYNSTNEPIVRVLSVEEFESTNVRPSRKDVYLTLDLLVNRHKKTNALQFKNKALEIGSLLNLHLANNYISGVVTFIEGISASREKKEVVIEGVIKDAWPWVAEAISLDNQMQDSRGNKIAQILDKKAEWAEKTVETADGRLVSSRDSLKRDIYIKAKLKVLEQGGNLYFYNSQKVTVGSIIWIFTPKIDLENIYITKVDEVPLQ